MSDHPWQSLKELLFVWPDLIHHANFLNPSNAIHWADLGRVLHTRFMLLTNIFSLGNLYTNIIFYNIIFFVGQLALYKAFFKLQPSKKWIYIFLIFLLPITLFWCSGMHKDGFTLAGLGFIALSGINLKESKSLRNGFAFFAALLFLLAFRYFYFICLMLPLILLMCLKPSKNIIWHFTGAYAICLLLFFGISKISTEINPAELVVKRQSEFKALNGRSRMPIKKLEPNPKSFLMNLPKAIQNVMLEPFGRFGWRGKFIVASLSMLFNLILIIYFLRHLKTSSMNEPFYWFALFGSVSILIFIGYTIPFLGALIRYKSAFLPLMLCGLASFSKVPNIVNRIGNYLDLNNPYFRIQ